MCEYEVIKSTQQEMVDEQQLGQEKLDKQIVTQKDNYILCRVLYLQIELIDKGLEFSCSILSPCQKHNIRRFLGYIP